MRPPGCNSMFEFGLPELFGFTDATSNCSFSMSDEGACAERTDTRKGRTKNEKRIEITSPPQSGVGRSSLSITSTSTGARCASSFRPSCSCMAVKSDGPLVSGDCSGVNSSSRSYEPVETGLIDDVPAGSARQIAREHVHRDTGACHFPTRRGHVHARAAIEGRRSGRRRAATARAIALSRMHLQLRTELAFRRDDKRVHRQLARLPARRPF